MASKKSPTVITDSAALNRAIDNIVKATGKLEADIQSALVGVVYQAAMHGNTEPANDLFSRIGKGVRKAAIQGWLDTNGPFLIDKEKGFLFSRDKLETLTGERKPTEEIVTAYCESLFSDLWTEHKPEKLAEESFDFRAALGKLLDKAAKARKGGAVIEGEELLATVNAVLVGVNPPPVAETEEPALM